MTRSVVFALIVGMTCLSLFVSSLSANRYFNNKYDIGIYQLRGSWYLNDQVPYRDVFSEYPQLATYMFAIPYVISDSNDPTTYRYIFSLIMALCLALLIKFVYELRPDKKYLAFLLLLPASLYFTHNRFDVVPSLFVLLSLKFLFDRNFYRAFAVLGISVMFKWYALVLLPVYLSYCRNTDNRDIKPLLLAFTVPIALIVLHSMIWSGWASFFKPYLYHLERGTNRENIAFFLKAIFDPILEKNFGAVTVKIISVAFLAGFMVLQFTVPFIALFSKINNRSSLIYWSVAAVACFMLFAKFYSPQWILWLSPLLLLMPVNRKLVTLIILFDIFTYLEFPCFFRYWNNEDILLSNAFYFVVLIRIGILFYIFWDAFSTIRHDMRLPFTGKRKGPVI